MKGAISKSKRQDLPLETHLEAFTEAILNASNFLLNPLTSSKNFRREFPGSTEVRTPHFHCLAQFRFLVEGLRSCQPRGMAKKLN